MPYEIFVRNALKPGSSPKLTIRNGKIHLNVPASQLLSGLGARFVHLLLDVDKGRFAIVPIQKEDENAFTISTQKERRGVSIAARTFLNYIGWQADEPVPLDVQWDPKEHMMEAQLPKEHVRSLAKSGKPTRLV